MEEELWLLILGLGAGGAAVNRRVMKAAAIGYVAATEAIGSVVGTGAQRRQGA